MKLFRLLTLITIAIYIRTVLDNFRSIMLREENGIYGKGDRCFENNEEEKKGEDDIIERDIRRFLLSNPKI